MDLRMHRKDGLSTYETNARASTRDDGNFVLDVEEGFQLELVIVVGGGHGRAGECSDGGRAQML